MRTIHAMYGSATDIYKTVVPAPLRRHGHNIPADHQVLHPPMPASRETVKTFGLDDLVIFGTPVYA